MIVSGKSRWAENSLTIATRESSRWAALVFRDDPRNIYPLRAVAFQGVLRLCASWIRRVWSRDSSALITKQRLAFSALRAPLVVLMTLETTAGVRTILEPSFPVSGSFSATSRESSRLRAFRVSGARQVPVDRLAEDQELVHEVVHVV